MNKNMLYRFFGDCLEAKAGRGGFFYISVIADPNQCDNEHIVRDMKELINEFILDKSRFNFKHDIEYEDESETIYGNVSYVCKIKFMVATVNDVLEYYRLRRVLKDVIQRREGFYIFGIDWTIC